MAGTVNIWHWTNGCWIRSSPPPPTGCLIRSNKEKEISCWLEDASILTLSLLSKHLGREKIQLHFPNKIFVGLREKKINFQQNASIENGRTFKIKEKVQKIGRGSTAMEFNDQHRQREKPVDSNEMKKKSLVGENKKIWKRVETLKD